MRLKEEGEGGEGGEGGEFGFDPLFSVHSIAQGSRGGDRIEERRRHLIALLIYLFILCIRLSLSLSLPFSLFSPSTPLSQTPNIQERDRGICSFRFDPIRLSLLRCLEPKAVKSAPVSGKRRKEGGEGGRESVCVFACRFRTCTEDRSEVCVCMQIRNRL